MKVIAWMYRYRPFLMGGDVHQAIKAELDVIDTQDIGRGYSAHVVKAPNGKSFYIEAACGAVMGNDLMMILADVKEGDQLVMDKQIEDGKRTRERAEMAQPELFWSYVKDSGTTLKVI